MQVPETVNVGECLNLDELTSRFLYANMVCKFLIAKLPVVFHHFIERVAGGWPRSIEHPCAFGTTPAVETLLFNPFQLAERCTMGRLARCE
jgi:hypothetical protein